MSNQDAQTHEPDARKPDPDMNAKVLAAIGGLCILLVVGFAVTSHVLNGNLEAHVHEGLSRGEIESYLGEPTNTMASTDEIPPEDRSRYDLPANPAPGGIVSYRPRYEPEWLTWLPTALPLYWNWVFVYYDENDIALEVHVRNFS